MSTKLLRSTIQERKSKILIVFDDMIADIISNEKRHLVVTKSFIRGWKLNISLVSVTHSYLPVPKDVRLNTTHFFIINIPKKQETQKIAFDHSSDINSKEMEIFIFSH